MKGLCVWARPTQNNAKTVNRPGEKVLQDHPALVSTHGPPNTQTIYRYIHRSTCNKTYIIATHAQCGANATMQLHYVPKMGVMTDFRQNSAPLQLKQRSSSTHRTAFNTTCEHKHTNTRFHTSHTLSRSSP